MSDASLPRQPVQCPQCDELNSPLAAACAVCRTPLVPVAMQSVAPDSALRSSPSAAPPQSLPQAPAQTPPASPVRTFLRVNRKRIRLAGFAWMAFWLIVAGVRISRVMRSPAYSALVTGKLTTTPSSPGVTAVPATSPQDKALIVAIGKGDEASVRSLLAAGASVSTASKHGIPALVMAASRGYLPIVQLLLDNGCNVNIKMPDRDSKGEMKGGYTALHFAGMNGHEDVIKLLLSKGADAHMTTVNGSTALDVTAMMGTPGAARLLIEGGSDVNHKINEGLTPLMGAADQGKTETVKVLLEKGADINIKGPFGESVLSHAVLSHHDDAAQVLRDAGAR